MEENLIEIAMKMILNAGDARNSIKEALDAVMDDNRTLAEEKLVESKRFIEQAHLYQTQVIQREAAGEPCSYSMLFTHAQDTLMTIYSEYHLAIKMSEMDQRLNDKIKTCKDEEDAKNRSRYFTIPG